VTIHRLPLLLILGLVLGGCWEVLTQQESETVWMAWDGSVQASPASLQIAAPAGDQADAELTLTETSGLAGVEIELAVEGAGAEHVTVHPGEFSVGLTPSGQLSLQVTFQAPTTASQYSPELVISTTGTPTEIRVPLQLESTGS